MTASPDRPGRELADAYELGAQAQSPRDDAPQWEHTLAFRVHAHDLIVAGDRLLGRVSAQHEPARLAVVEAIDAALAAGVTEADVDAALARLRAGS